MCGSNEDESETDGSESVAVIVDKLFVDISGDAQNRLSCVPCEPRRIGSNVRPKVTRCLVCHRRALVITAGLSSLLPVVSFAVFVSGLSGIRRLLDIIYLRHHSLACYSLNRSVAPLKL